ncbi:dopamine beta-hydroxylase [Rhinolophus ferrumequinum]|uniref:Dopamine beta-hydroxylase n=1 Tax=Rhinolophus ferrumequinum TaxID=59479 RepID=A0A7J7VPT5_RHIFE|nr:dopamine beta-hydroxylase [Rhinolophus ferrumequinum]
MWPSPASPDPAGPASLGNPHLRLSAPHTPDGEEGGHRAGPGRQGEADSEQGRPLQPSLPGDPHVEEGCVCPPGRCAHYFLYIQHGGQDAGHRGPVLTVLFSVSQGGFGILQEMCVNYVHYYPQTPLELCKSAVDTGFLQKYFHLVNRFNSEEVCTCPQASVPEQFASVPWNSFNRDVLKALYDFAPISMHCNKSSAVRFQGEWSLQPLPEIISKLEEPAPRCPASRGPSSGGPTMVSIGGGKG